jgi:hypothetical protein
MINSLIIYPNNDTQHNRCQDEHRDAEDRPGQQQLERIRPVSEAITPVVPILVDPSFPSLHVIIAVSIAEIQFSHNPFVSIVDVDAVVGPFPIALERIQG